MNAYEARTFYDSFGRKQDSQEFYEEPAQDDLLDHVPFDELGCVFEFGGGTDRLAERLPTDRLPASVAYIACDVSTTMAGLAAERLKPCKERVFVFQSDDTVRFPLSDNRDGRSNTGMWWLPGKFPRRWWLPASGIPAGVVAISCELIDVKYKLT